MTQPRQWTTIEMQLQNFPNWVNKTNLLETFCAFIVMEGNYNITLHMYVGSL